MVGKLCIWVSECRLSVGYYIIWYNILMHNLPRIYIYILHMSFLGAKMYPDPLVSVIIIIIQKTLIDIKQSGKSSTFSRLKDPWFIYICYNYMYVCRYIHTYIYISQFDIPIISPWYCARNPPVGLLLLTEFDGTIGYNWCISQPGIRPPGDGSRLRIATREKTHVSSLGFDK